MSPAPKYNKYWKFREKHGRDFKYSPDILWDEAEKYFEWVTSNPLMEEKQFAFQGKVTTHNAPKMSAMTITGFCLFADITLQTLENYKANKDFIDIVTRIENIIKTQKFEGAAAELLNSNIIARDLGLTDNSKLNIGGQKGNPLTHLISEPLTAKEMKKFNDDIETEY